MERYDYSSERRTESMMDSSILVQGFFECMRVGWEYLENGNS